MPSAAAARTDGSGVLQGPPRGRDERMPKLGREFAPLEVCEDKPRHPGGHGIWVLSAKQHCRER